ncbi:hypothetical protein CR513_00347, partial [Mucuna pruriens]
MVNGSVLNEKMRRKEQGSSSQYEVLATENRRRSQKKEREKSRTLKMGNDGVTKVIDVGDVCLQTNTGMQLWLRGVKHAPDVHFNLIFVHMLDDGGYDNHFGHGKWKLTKDSVNVMDMEASLWHQRLNHINEKGLNCLAKKDMLLGLKNAELEKCSHYMAEALDLCLQENEGRE